MRPLTPWRSRLTERVVLGAALVALASVLVERDWLWRWDQVAYDAAPRFIQMIVELIRERIEDGAPRLALGSMGPSHDFCPADCCPAPVRLRAAPETR